MLNFHVRHVMVVEKFHKIISFKPSKWLDKYININLQKKKKVKKNFEKDFHKLLNNAFYGKTMENGRNRLGLEFNKKKD